MIWAIVFISAFSRFLQRCFPKTPVRGLSRLGNILRQLAPSYEAIVEMNPRFKMRLYSRQEAEMSLIMLGTYQPALSHIIMSRLRPNDHCLDIGANLGFFSLTFASQVRSSGRVAAFEANPMMAARIRDAAALNGFQIDIVEKAVHEKSGEKLQFYVSRSPGKSSIFAENVQELVEELQVESISIDDYLVQMNWPRVDIIKMDIEGNDTFALLGAEKTIREHRPFIVFEYSGSSSEVQARLASIFAEAGYHLEILLLNGSRQTFGWQVPQGFHHVDVLAFPN